MITPQLLKLLRSVDTPTVCNAIEVAQGKRGSTAFSRGTLIASDPSASAMVGYARTATIRANTPPADTNQAKALRADYYRYIAEAPKPAVVVIQDTDFPNCIGAFWGELNTHIHRAFGLCGTLTNGVMRDLGDLAPSYPVLAGSVGPSHAYVHVTGFDQAVEVFDLNIRPHDLIHADRHGAVVIPPEVMDQLEQAIHKLIASEKIILDATQDPNFNYQSFARAWAAFEKVRT